MTDRVHLTHTPSRPWTRSGAANVTGWAWLKGRSLNGVGLAHHLDVAPEDFVDRVKQLSGSFAAILETSGAVLAATDRTRSIPLFYTRDGVVSDDALWLLRRAGGSVDSPEAAAEFLLTTCTTGSSTLSSAVRQIRAGEAVLLGADQPESRRYYRFGAGPFLEGDEQELEDEAVRLFEESFEALLNSVRDQPVAVPLSGGIDSRLVAAMLVRGGRTDARCFSYGQRSSEEARISRMVAAALGLEWDFARYTSARWSRWFHSTEFQDFRLRAGGLCSIEHEQDWPAVKVLLARGFLLPDTVMIPGHSCDFRLRVELPIRSAAAAIWSRFYSEWPTSGISADLKAALLARIDAATEDLEGIEAFNLFGWQERQSKMVINSVRVYEHHGLPWRLPLWDGADLLDFWGRLPPDLRVGRRLYRKVVHRLIGEVFDLPQAKGPAHPLIGKWRSGTDADMRRYGIWLGGAPLVRGVVTRIRDLGAVDHEEIGPMIKQITGPMADRPPQWAGINGLLALSHLRDLVREFG